MSAQIACELIQREAGPGDTPWSANQVFSNPITIGDSGTQQGLLYLRGSNSNGLVLENSSGAAGSKIWYIRPNTVSLDLNFTDDGWSGSWPTYMSFERNGMLPTRMLVHANIQTDYGVIAAAATFNGAVTMQSAVITNPIALPSGNSGLTPTAEGLLMYDYSNHTAYISTGTAAGSDLATCQNADDTTASTLPPGYCYVDPSAGSGASRTTSPSASTAKT